MVAMTSTFAANTELSRSLAASISYPPAKNILPNNPRRIASLSVATGRVRNNSRVLSMSGSSSSSGGGLTYKDAGVDIDAGSELVKRIAKMAPGIGGFGGLFPLGDSYLVAGTDGVGTKLKLAFETGIHETIGVDLVAMSVNDIVTSGAKPLFFLDYFATSHLDVDLAEKVIKGIVDGCQQSDCALLGGETAEMPDFYAAGEYDLSGFSVGIVKKESVIDGKSIVAGDVLIGLPSSGVHSNGFSLVRRVLSQSGLSLKDQLPGENISLGEALMAPTVIYVKQVLDIISKGGVKGIAHITGGGFTDNIPRVFPKGLGSVIYEDSWKVPAVFKWIQQAGEDLGDDLEKVVFMHGFDREGHPVCYNVYGEFQNKQLYHNTFSDEGKRIKFLRWRIQFLERSIRKLNFSPGGVSTIFQVNDLKNSPGPGKRELRIATKQALQLLQDNYPEFVAKQVFINVPWWYLAFYTMINPFMTQRTKSKFVFAGPSKSPKTLFKYISSEHVPVQYGGLSVDYCDCNPEFTIGDPATEITIGPSTKQNVEIIIFEKCTIVWEIRVVGWEVSYGAEFVPDDADKYTIIIQNPKKLSPTDEPVVCHRFKVNEMGKILLTVDNPTSKRKKLLYRFKVEPFQA